MCRGSFLSHVSLTHVGALFRICSNLILSMSSQRRAFSFELSLFPTRVCAISTFVFLFYIFAFFSYTHTRFSFIFRVFRCSLCCIFRSSYVLVCMCVWDEPEKRIPMLTLWYFYGKAKKDGCKKCYVPKPMKGVWLVLAKAQEPKNIISKSSIAQQSHIQRDTRRVLLFI